jgi:hypothetical protein
MIMALPRRLDHGATSILSHVSDGAVEAMLAVVQCRCRVILVLSLLWRHSRGAMLILSHADDGAVEATLVVARCRY